MTAIAIAIAVAHPAAVDPAPAAIVDDADPYDFSGDGRLASPRAAARTAWAAPDFYLALAIGVVLAIAVLIIRLCDARSAGGLE